MPLRPGQTVSHYRIVRMIGQGGMGEVYLAEDMKLERRVALKVLPAAFAADGGRLARFEREAKSIAALNHPNIVTLHSVAEADGHHFLTMELVDGVSLDERIPAGGASLEEVLRVGIALADALAAAHEKGIVHRDLKPANVMLTKDGRLKVLDFGLAKLVPWTGFGAVPSEAELSEMATRDRSLTDAGFLTGTVPYMSPEQAQGKPVDARTDLFSLGVVLYEMTTGRRPFGGASPAETLSSILRDTPHPVTQARPDAPRHLARIIEHCLQKDPQRRFQTARDVCNQLLALRNEGDSTQAETAAADRSRPRRWIGLVAAAALVATAAVLWIALASGRGAAPQTGTGETTATTASIAVLPFVDMSSSKDQEYFSDGLSEELINVLTRIPELKVSGRTSSFSFKGKNDDLRSIAEKLGVESILEGSVRKAGDKIRITAQLVTAADGFHLWSQTYDRSLEDVFAVQDDIAASVARELRVRLLPETGSMNEPDSAAYDLELQARFVMNTRWTPAGDRVAREILERGLAAAPGYARLWLTKARLHLREMNLATTAEARNRAREETRAAVAKTLALDPNLNAHTSVGWCQLNAWEFDDAQRSFERALAVAPREAPVLGAAGLFLLWTGRTTEAIALFERAADADPLDGRVRQNEATALIRVGRLDEARALLQQALDLSPEWSLSYLSLFELHMVRGELDQARTALVRYGELVDQAEYYRLLADALASPEPGRTAASAAAAAEFEKRFGPDNPVDCAMMRGWRDEPDAAFVWLDRAFAARDPLLVRIKGDLSLRSLRTDPRWNGLLRKLGLPPEMSS